MNRWRTLFLVAAVLASREARPEPPKPDPLNDVRFLVGCWTGSSDGEAGKGSVSRTYEAILFLDPALPPHEGTDGSNRHHRSSNDEGAP